MLGAASIGEADEEKISIEEGKLHHAGASLFAICCSTYRSKGCLWKPPPLPMRCKYLTLIALRELQNEQQNSIYAGGTIWL